MISERLKSALDKESDSKEEELLETEVTTEEISENDIVTTEE